MQIVIDVSENLYNNLKDLYVIAPHMISKEEMMYAISNGTILPENHGRLIDADALKQSLEESLQGCCNWANNAKSKTSKVRAEQAYVTFLESILRLKQAPTIIEADKED